MVTNIKHANIFYVREIHSIGGVETYVYELVKKYKDYDIAVVCKSIDKEQKKRIQKYCKVYIHTNQKIECKVAIINFDTSIIDYITKDIWKENAKGNEGIYQGIHADYTHKSQGKLPQDKRIKSYLAITEDVLNNFSKLSNEKNVMLCRNPYSLEEEQPMLILVSPTRLTKEKGGELMLRLANALDNLKISYVWFILTTKQYLNEPIFSNQNVVWIKNRLDVGKFLNIANWVVLPSDCEGDSYTIREALYRGIPIVAKHLKYFDEYKIEDNKNALFINDNNVMDVARRMQIQLKFKFKPIDDGYDMLIHKSKSRYEEERRMKYLVEALDTYKKLNLSDGELGRVPEVGETWEITKDRLDVLLGDNDMKQEFVKVIKQIKPEKKKAIKPKSKVEKAIK